MGFWQGHGHGHEHGGKRIWSAVSGSASEERVLIASCWRCGRAGEPASHRATAGQPASARGSARRGRGRESTGVIFFYARRGYGSGRDRDNAATTKCTVNCVYLSWAPLCTLASKKNNGARSHKVLAAMHRWLEGGPARSFSPCTLSFFPSSVPCRHATRLTRLGERWYLPSPLVAANGGESLPMMVL